MKSGFELSVRCICVFATFLASCAEPFDDGSRESRVEMSVVASESHLKSNVLDELRHEGTLHRVEYFFFDSASGQMALHGIANDLDVSSWNGNLSLPRGRYDCVVIANGPDLSGCSTMMHVMDAGIEFEEFNNAENGFCMSRISRLDASGPEASLDCRMERLVSRVWLRSITNGLPGWMGDFFPEYCVLNNAVGGSCTLAGDAGGLEWINRQGRVGKHSQKADEIIDGEAFLPECGEQTFRFLDIAPIGTGCKGISEAPICFYTYPNVCRTVPKPFSTDFSGSMTVLTVVGTVNGIRYYYPVTLSEGLESGCTYAVDLTICSLGSADPCVPSDECGRNVSVRLEKWADGMEYQRNI